MSDTQVSSPPAASGENSDADQVEQPWDDLTPPDTTPDVVEVHRNAATAAVLGVVAAIVAIAYLQRAAESGSVLDWSLTGVLFLLAGYWLHGFLDARVPLLVADAQGVRVRLGRTWRGLPWSAVQHIEHTHRPRGLRGLVRDGRLVVVPNDEERVLADLDGPALRQARISTRLYGAPLALPLGLTTRVTGADGDLAAALASFGSRTDVVVIEHGLDGDEDLVEDTAGDRADDLGEDLVDELADQPADELADDPELDELDAPVEPTVALPVVERLQGRELNVPGRVTLIEESRTPEVSRVEPEVEAPTSQTSAVPELIETPAVDPVMDLMIDPVIDPVIGPQLAAARTRLGLSVESLAERTRIRPHVIEAIEADDFGPCGGDFYAKGHLRTLARVLGQEAEPLVASYENLYAHAPIDPRRVFEADLAGGSGNSSRSARGGPNWSLLVAVVMAIVLAWSIARLVMDNPTPLRDTPVLNGSAGPNGSAPDAAGAAPVPVTVTAAGGGARVVVRDRDGKVVFRGNLAKGESTKIKVSAPLRVQSSDGATTVAVGDAEPAALGESGVSAQRSFVSR